MSKITGPAANTRKKRASGAESLTDQPSCTQETKESKDKKVPQKSRRIKIDNKQKLLSTYLTVHSDTEIEVQRNKLRTRSVSGNIYHTSVQMNMDQSNVKGSQSGGTKSDTESFESTMSTIDESASMDESTTMGNKTKGKKACTPEQTSIMPSMEDYATPKSVAAMNGKAIYTSANNGPTVTSTSTVTMVASAPTIVVTSMGSGSPNLQRLEQRIDTFKRAQDMAKTPQQKDNMETILKTLSTMSSTLNQVKNNQDASAELIQGVQFVQEQDREELQRQGTAIRILQDKVEIMSNLLINKEQTIEQLQERVLKLEAQNMKSNLLISGIVEQESENVTQVVKDFFKNQLKIEEDVAIDVAFRMGKPDKTDRTILVKLQMAKSKGLIYAHTTNLKGTTNSKGQKYNVNDQLPEELAE